MSCAVAALAFGLTACGGSSSSTSSTSSSIPAASLTSLKSCLQKAGSNYKLNSANPGQVTVSIPPDGNVTLTIESSPQKAKKDLASANRGAAAFFGPNAPKNIVVGTVLLGGLQKLSAADLAKIKSCAAAV